MAAPAAGSRFRRRGSADVALVSPLTLLDSILGAHGGPLFVALAKGLALLLDIRRVEVVEADPADPLSLRALAVWDGDGLQRDPEVRPLPPVLDVLERGPLVVARDVQRVYPGNHLLVELGAQGFAAAPMVSAGARVLGYVALVHDRPLDAHLDPLPALRVFAAQAAAELERRRLEAALDERERRERERSSELQVLTRRLLDRDAGKHALLDELGPRLREPLAPIRSALDVLRLAMSDHEQVSWAVQVIERQLCSLLRLLGDPASMAMGLSTSAAETAPGDWSAARPKARACAGTPRRLLVVDDHLESARTLARVLETRGHEVRLAHDGLAALDAVGRYPLDAVLLDIGLPGMDGFEVARRIRARPENEGLRLIAVTGYGWQDDRHSSRLAGFDHHLVKPFVPDALESVLEALLA
jgi:two-component system, OmpR family, response regulator